MYWWAYIPILTREKPNSENRRVIVDLSWPIGESVNGSIDKHSYLGTDFTLSLPTIDHITDQVKAIGRDCQLYNVDISRAFRHIKVDPLNYDLLGLSWRHIYLDTCVPFGSRHSSQIFQRCSDTVRFIMRQNGHTIVGYVDNYIGFGTPTEAEASFQTLVSLLHRLGLTISEKNLVPPSTQVTCFGVKIDTANGFVSIPPEKMQAISDMVIDWQGKKFCTKRQLQSLLGHLLYIHKCVKPAKFFLNRMLELLRNAHNAACIKLIPAFYRDLRWFKNFLPHFNGVALYDHKKIDCQTHLDACLQGLGGIYGSQVYHLKTPLGFRSLNIAHLEMVNILVATKMFCHQWSKKSVQIFCDNSAVVWVLQSGRTKDPYLAACARNGWLWAGIFDINFVFSHIRGKSNCIADLLSRWSYTSDNYAALKQLVPNFHWHDLPLDMLELDNDI